MRRLAVRLLLLIGGLAAALGLAESLTPLGLPRHACGGRVPFWRPDRATGWALVPGMQGEAVVCAGARELARHPIEINALGQRDRPRSLTRVPSMPRVLVLGDSFVEALQVDFSETFAARLERDLGVEMLNAGVSGYSTDNELRAFLSTGRRYHPDAVLLLFHVGNDVFENGARLYAWREAWTTTEALLGHLQARIGGVGRASPSRSGPPASSTTRRCGSSSSAPAPYRRGTSNIRTVVSRRSSIGSGSRGSRSFRPSARTTRPPAARDAMHGTVTGTRRGTRSSPRRCAAWSASSSPPAGRSAIPCSSRRTSPSCTACSSSAIRGIVPRSCRSSRSWPPPACTPSGACSTRAPASR